jgi:hypothetical protein
MMNTQKVESLADVKTLIGEIVKEIGQGVGNRRDEALELARQWLPKDAADEVERQINKAREVYETKGVQRNHLTNVNIIRRRLDGSMPKPKPEPEAAKPEAAKPEPEPEPEAEPDADATEVKASVPAIIPSTKPLTIDRAAKWESVLTEMNKQHALIENYGGKCVIACWEPAPIPMYPDHKRLAFQGKDSFLLRYSNQPVTIEVPDGRGGYSVLTGSLGAWWLKHRGRRQHRGIVFRPKGLEVVNDCLNLYQGWGVVPEPGDWSLIRRHIKEILANNNDAYAEYIIRWIAWAIQNPDAQAEVCLVLIGHKGTGKGTLAKLLRRIFGAHAFQVTSRDEVIGNFNAHLEDCILFIADEAYWGGEKKTAGRLQGMITEETLSIERKGYDLIKTPNYLHIIMLAEPGWVIPAGRYERRYATFFVSEAQMQKPEYFKPLHAQISGGGAAAMLWELQRMELDDWHPRQIPESLLKGAALGQQQSLTLSPLEQWYLSLLEEGRIPQALIKTEPDSGKKSRPNTAYTHSLISNAKEGYARLRLDLTTNMLQAFLEDPSWPKATKYRDTKGNGWSFFALQESREAWDRRYSPRKWNNVQEWRDLYLDEGSIMHLTLG